MKLYVIRHGRTDLNEKGIMQGLNDCSINLNGIKDAEYIKDKLKDINFDICISSPLKRTLETSKIVVNNKCNIITDNLIIERNLGEFEGKKYDEYFKLKYWDYKLNNNLFNVEPVRCIFKRTKLFLDNLKKENYKNVLIVSHSAPIRAINYNINGYDSNTNFLEFKAEHAKVYEYDI